MRQIRFPRLVGSRPGRRVRSGLFVVAVLLALAAAAQPRTEAGAAVSARPAGGEQHWVTLVTGDRVLLEVAEGQERVVTVRAGEGRHGVSFRQESDRGDLYVVPADAEPLVTAGRVDRRLFNVSRLVDDGYDDQLRPALPLIVAYQDGPAARAAQSRLSAVGGEVTRELPSIDADAVEVEKVDTGGFWEVVTGTRPQALSGGLARLWLDGPVTASLDQSVPQVGAPAAWEAGHTGAGAVVAVLDTGVDVDHPDLADAVIGAHDFTGSESGTDDLAGHGTHVAGIITGNGAASGGRYQGVAPDVRLLNGKVLDDYGFGDESGIIAGMEWAVAQGADVVNMSLGGWPSDGTDPMDEAVNTLTAESGTLFVVSAGNDGPHRMTVNSPGAADRALTVGAVDKQDELADFSSRGPRQGDQALKPDLTAPGVEIVAPLAEGAWLGEDYPIVDGRYLSLTGTSMAAPHVAAAAAILAAEHPEWDADELKPALMGTAAPRAGLTIYEQGTGRLDVARAAAQQIFATTPQVDYGTASWPHDDDEPVGRTVTYRNDGPVTVTLDLTADVRDPEGNPAPAGMFTLDSAQVTVPAGGTASVELVTDTSVPAPDGSYTGLLHATDGQIMVRTPVHVTREVESYDVTLTFLDHTGEPAPAYSVRLVNLDRPEAVLPYDPSGTAIARVPRGRHYFEAVVYESRQRPFDTSTIMVEPELDVTGDLTLVWDARHGEPVGIAVDQPTARPAEAGVAFDRFTSWGVTGSTFISADFDRFLVRPSTTAAPGQFRFRVGAALAEPDGAGGFAESPYLYHVDWSEDGRVPAELVRSLPDQELATVQTTIGSSAPAQIASKDWIVDLVTPATITEHYTPGTEHHPSVVLRSADAEDFFDIDSIVWSAGVTYERGQTVAERWNVAVFGPSFYRDSWVAREGNTLGFDLYLHGDPAPGHYGGSAVDSLEVTLSLDGQQVGQWLDSWAEVAVPAEPGRYRLEATATRSVSPLSTEISTAWTFRSGQTESIQPLPVMAVRYAPDLDDHSRARAGVPFTFPVHIQQQADADFGRLRTLHVQVSYDDGDTWLPVPLLGSGLERTARVFHPRDGEFVSLRATAVDRHGNSVEQTIIRAYALA